MKNKSKLKKIAEKKKQSSCPREWLYLNTKQISARELAEVFDGENGNVSQLWEDAGVVEIELPEAKSIDFEVCMLPSGEDEFDEEMKQRGISTVFLVTLAPDEFEKAQVAMKQIIGALGGFFCGDNADFSPIVDA